MKRSVISLTAAAAAAFIGQASAQTVIQFGGDHDHLQDGGRPQDGAWTSAVGAEQIIQWNGVNYNSATGVFGNFGTAGTLANLGVGASLTSVGPEAVTLTTRALDATDTTSITTGVTGSPNLLGVNAGVPNDGVKFEADFAESWTFDFDQDVTWISMISAAMDFNLERFGIDIGNTGTNDYEWNRSAGFIVGSGIVDTVDFGGPDEYLATFASPITLPAGTDVRISGAQGAISLEGLVISIPEPSSFALLAGILALGSIAMRRRS